MFLRWRNGNFPEFICMKTHLCQYNQGILAQIIVVFLHHQEKDLTPALSRLEELQKSLPTSAILGRYLRNWSRNLRWCFLTTALRRNIADSNNRLCAYPIIWLYLGCRVHSAIPPGKHACPSFRLWLFDCPQGRSHLPRSHMYQILPFQLSQFLHVKSIEVGIRISAMKNERIEV